MKTEIQIFTSDIFGKVRTCQVNNQIMFVGKDVATALGYSKSRNALATHVDAEDKKDALIQGPLGGTQKMTIINESGLYSLILSSKLPQAKAFKRWVTSEVLPSIRKTGRYELPQQIPALAMLNEDAEAVQKETGVKVNARTLPIGLKESLTGVPVSMHMPVLCGVMPIAAAYADQVQVKYCDGNLQHLGLMSIIRGEQASNKSVVKNAIDVWKRQFDEEDALARKREEEWKERKKGRKANEKAPEDPKVLIRMVPVTVSCSTLLKRFKNANGHCIYSFGEALRNEYVSAQDECQRYGANHSVFDQLAPTFSRDDLRALKTGTTESGLRNIVMRWKRDGWIVPIDRHHWQKVASE